MNVNIGDTVFVANVSFVGGVSADALDAEVYVATVADKHSGNVASVYRPSLGKRFSHNISMRCLFTNEEEARREVRDQLEAIKGGWNRSINRLLNIYQ